MSGVELWSSKDHPCWGCNRARSAGSGVKSCLGREPRIWWSPMEAAILAGWSQTVLQTIAGSQSSPGWDWAFDRDQGVVPAEPVDTYFLLLAWEVAKIVIKQLVKTLLQIIIMTYIKARTSWLTWKTGTWLRWISWSS